MTITIEILSVAGALGIQDQGRAGYQRYGVAEGGAMDQFALHQGAALLAQSAQLAALEMAGGGGRFRVVSGRGMLACTGATMALSVNDRSLPWGCGFEVHENDVITIAAATNGVYGYLHIAGGFDVPAVLGSRSTHSRAGFGGHQGRTLQPGECIRALVAASHNRPMRLPLPDYLDSSVIRIVWGAQAHLFDSVIKQRFLDASFSVSVKRDRMGAKLDSDGGTFLPASGLTGISDAVLAGDIQIAGDGGATVLLADRQPTGGYPRIATVIGADLDAVAQLRSGRSFRFELLTIEQAVDALKTRRAKLQQIASRLQPLVRDPADISDLLSYNLIDGMTAGRELAEK